MDWVARIRAGFLVAACAPFAVACGSTNDSESTPNVGFVLAYEREETWYGTASYYEAVKSTCSSERVEECYFDTPCTDIPTPPTFLDAGTLTVEDTPLERTLSYFSPLLSPIIPGDWVEVAAAGSADVPAHSGSVRLPPLVTVTEPAVDDGLAIDRSKDFEVAWTPVDVGKVTISIESPGNRLTCIVPARLGRFTVPSAALQRLPATDATTSGGFGLIQWDVTELRPKGWEISLSAEKRIMGTAVDLL